MSDPVSQNLRLYDVSKLTAIANAIRAKNGSSDTYTVGDMPTAIQNLPSGGTVSIVQTSSLLLDGDTWVELPNQLVSPDRSYYIDFTTSTQADATGEHVIFGIKNEYYYNFVGIFYMNLRYQIGQNGGYTNVSNSWDELTGRHNFLYDGAGHVQFDGTNTYTYDPSNTIGDGYTICLGTGGATPRTGHIWKGLIHQFTIRDTANDVVIANYVPANRMIDDTVVDTGLYDTVSGTFISAITHYGVGKPDRLFYLECVGNDDIEIPAVDTLTQDTLFSTYLSFNSSTRKFTVLKKFSAVVTGWVYQYQAPGHTYSYGEFKVNGDTKASYRTYTLNAGDKGGTSIVLDFDVGDVFWVFTPYNDGYPQQFCKVYVMQNTDVRDTLVLDDETT